jgi:glycosyltransferase involved in cell wall biosynthesis
MLEEIPVKAPGGHSRQLRSSSDTNNFDPNRGLVSVCLPVYNGDRYLQTAIQSILAQSYSHLELIIFDDFSADHSLEIIEHFAAQDNRIHHWRNGRRLGLFETYNQCMGQANGEYIKLFSQADLLHSQAIENCVMQLDSEPGVALVTVGNELIDARGGPLKNPDKEWTREVFKPFRPIDSAEVLNKCLFPLVNYLGEASSVMFRSKFQGHGFDSRLHQYAEIDYWLRIIMQGDCICLPDAYAHIRHHLGSAAVSNSRNLMGACDLIKIARKFSRVIEACGKTEEEFLDLSIKSYVSEIQTMVADGTVAAAPLRRADDLRGRAALASSHETSASATAAFSALASALVGGDVSSVSFSSEPNASGKAMLEDLIDFREFAFHAIRMLSAISLPGSPALQAPAANTIVVTASPQTEAAKLEAESPAFEAVEPEVWDPDEDQAVSEKANLLNQDDLTDFAPENIERIARSTRALAEEEEEEEESGPILRTPKGTPVPDFDMVVTKPLKGDKSSSGKAKSKLKFTGKNPES